MTAPPVTSAAELWQRLLTGGGIQPDGWDADLVAELRALLALPAHEPLEQSLADASVSPEAFVSAFFASVAGYADMLSALLAFLGRHRASADTDTIAIEFDFGEAKLPFTLSELERLRERVKRAVTTTKPTYRWDPASYWTMKGFLQRVIGDLKLPVRDIDHENARSGPWPAPTRTHVPISHGPLDRQLTEAWAVWRSVVIDCSDLTDAPAKLRLTSAQDPHEHLLAGLISDYYLQQLENGIDAIADGYRTSALNDAAAQHLAAELEDFFAAHPPIPVKRQSAIDEFDEFLNLPVWNQRHELYATWVLTEIAGACPRGVSLHLSDEDTLCLPFRPTVVADVVGCDPPLQIWSELRTPLTQPRGEGRQKAIQPDFSILATGGETPTDLRTESELRTLAKQSVLEVECKQYRRAAPKNFAAAIEDYARGRPQARTILASHGPLNRDRLLDRVPAQYAARSDAIALLSPRQLESRRILHSAVVAAVEPYLVPLPAPEEPGEPDAPDTASTTRDRKPLPAVSDLAMLVTLTWHAGPRDLDLHLIADGEVGSVGYTREGALDQQPFALLDIDDTNAPGRERIGVAKWVARRYLVCVAAYGGDSSFAFSDAELVIELGGDVTRIGCCTGASTHRWWHVATIDVDPGSSSLARVTIVDTLLAEKPAATS